MADGDLVVPVKWESPSQGGTEEDMSPSGLDPNQDGIAVRRVYIQPGTSGSLDKTVGLEREDATSELRLFDSLVSAKLSDLLGGGSSIFGSDYHHQEGGTGWQSTSGTGWSTVLDFTFTATGGLYRIATAYEWRYSSISRDFQARVRLTLNGANSNLAVHRQEPKDTGSDQSYPAAFWLLRRWNVGDTVRLRLQFRASSSWDTARIRRAVLDTFRVEV